LFAGYSNFVSPDLFGFAVASQVLIVVCLGGRGTIIGPILGALAIGLIGPKISESNPESWQLILGGAFLAVVLVAPDGVLPAATRGIAYLRDRLRSKGAPPRTARRPSLLTPVSTEQQSQPPGTVLGEVADVAKSFGALEVLHNVSIDFRSAEVLCIIGPNGAGKSTLMNVITDASDHASGRITLGGRVVNGQPPDRIARLGVGRTFQGTALMETYTVADSLFVASQAGRAPSVWRRTTEVKVPEFVATLAGYTELDQTLDVRVADLSHGKRQALELCMAMALHPRLLFLDEPTAGLTHDERNEVGQLLRELVGRGLGVVLIEHDLEFVRRITDRVAVLHRGEVLAEGGVDEIADSPLVREIYLGASTT
jgi:branched-chain amino acid transport system permease protein